MWHAGHDDAGQYALTEPAPYEAATSSDPAPCWAKRTAESEGTPNPGSEVGRNDGPRSSTYAGVLAPPGTSRPLSSKAFHMDA